MLALEERDKGLCLFVKSRHENREGFLRCGYRWEPMDKKFRDFFFIDCHNESWESIVIVKDARGVNEIMDEIGKDFKLIEVHQWQSVKSEFK